MRKASRNRSTKRVGPGARFNARGPRALLFAVLLVTASRVPPTVEAESSATGEYEVKAAFLFHFAQFVEWPPEAFKEADSPLTYCTVGEDAFRGALDESVKGKRIGNRQLRVRHLGEQEPIDGCQVLFIAGVHKMRQTDELATVRGRPVLTVGETEQFVQDGGIIGFLLVEKKVRFEINLESAEKSGLKISAKLLALAKTVVGSSRGN